MMTRKIQRELIELLQALHTMVANEGQAIDWLTVSESLQEVDTICRKQLSSEHYTKYGDYLQVLLLTISEVDWSKLWANNQSEFLELFTEIIDLLIETLLQETEIKKVLVFLPYKASMWDSLESIWLAAIADSEHSETYVVPIPYAELTPKLTVAEWKCERHIFPSDIPTCDWQDFTLEKLQAMRPDYIFIHNPYDNMNRVTMVDGQYHSDRLKACTDCLVYSPYFVTGYNIAPYMVQTPAVNNADYVLVESEWIKGLYERYYRGDYLPENKILALGSPKYDKVVTAKRDDFTLPLAWQKIIAGRKTILYNTSLDMALRFTEYLVDKIRNVLAIFKEEKDIVLWWRPHPLMKATLKSLRLEVYEEYEKIVQEYIAGGWGIYDDTPDINRAIACTDAYYGDTSSVIFLYQALGRKLLISSYDNKYEFLSVSATNGKFYFTIIRQPFLFSLDKITDKVQIVAKIPNSYWHLPETDRLFAGYMATITVRDGLLLVPAETTRDILHYDLYNGRFSTIPTSNLLADNGLLAPTCRMQSGLHLRHEHSVFILGTDFLLRYDEINRQVTEIADCRRILATHMKSDQYRLMLAGAIHNGKLYIPHTQADIVIIVDIATGISREYSLQSKVGGWCSLIFAGGYCWLLAARAACLLRLQPDTGEEELYPFYRDIDISPDLSQFIFGYMARRGNSLIIFPVNENKVVVFDLVNHNIGVLREEEITTAPYSFALQEGNDILALHNRKRGSAIMSISDKAYEYNIVLNSDIKRSIFTAFQEDGISPYFEPVVDIKDFIAEILTDTVEHRPKYAGDSGKCIYKYLMENPPQRSKDAW